MAGEPLERAWSRLGNRVADHEELRVQGMTMANIIVLACGALALLYGLVTARQVLAADAGSPRMQEIAAAVQEGAKAYLNRQYTTIGIVGIVICILLFAMLGAKVAIGFV